MSRHSDRLPSLTAQAMKPILFQATLVGDLGVDGIARHMKRYGAVKRCIEVGNRACLREGFDGALHYRECSAVMTERNQSPASSPGRIDNLQRSEVGQVLNVLIALRVDDHRLIEVTAMYDTVADVNNGFPAYLALVLQVIEEVSERRSMVLDTVHRLLLHLASLFVRRQLEAEGCRRRRDASYAGRQKEVHNGMARAGGAFVCTPEQRNLE